MIPHTTIYSHTELPFSEWKPAYVIVGVWEGAVLHTPWISYDLWNIARPEAEKLIRDFYLQGRWGERMMRTCRWREDICDAIALCVRGAGEGLQVKVRYPPIQEDHCRQFTLTRR